MASTHKNIPVELVVKILLPQPVESLLRLMCVCKLWNQVITSKSFIKSHLGHPKTLNRYLLVDNCSLLVVDSESYDVLESHDCNKDCIFGNQPKVYGVCKGLVCLSDCQDIEWYNTDPDPDQDQDQTSGLHGSLYLWNPLVRKGKKLPPVGIGFEVKHEYCASYLCFGYHDDDYKVIKVVPFPHMYHVYIYSLSTDCWNFKEIEITHNDDDDDDDDDDGGFYVPIGFDTYPKAILVTGVAYFVKESWRNNQFHLVLVSFDLSCEQIKEIDFPRDFDFDIMPVFGDYFRIEEYEESIALTRYSKYDDNNVVIWILRARPSDKSFSWDKMCTIESKTKYHFQPIGLINNKKLVIRRIPRLQHCLRHCRVNWDDLRQHICPHTRHYLCDVDDKKGSRFRISKGVTKIYSLEENLLLLNETTVHPFVKTTQSCSSKATGRIKEENKDTGAN